MRATGIAIAMAVGVCVATPVHAHSTPAQRSVVVQIEGDTALLLVSWTAPSGVLGKLLLLRAALKPGTLRATFTALMAKRAIAPLTVTLDGRDSPLKEEGAKLTVDTSPSRRHAVTLLLRVALGTATRVRVSAGSGGGTRLLWQARNRPAESVSGGVAANTWSRSALELVLVPIR